jgi:hypothetical protein
MRVVSRPSDDTLARRRARTAKRDLASLKLREAPRSCRTNPDMFDLRNKEHGRRRLRGSFIYRDNAPTGSSGELEAISFMPGQRSTPSYEGVGESDLFGSG